MVGATWSCTSTPPGALVGPEGLDDPGRDWMGAQVPGTVAAALRDMDAAGASPGYLDGRDWWFRCRFRRPAGSDAPDGWILECDGLATLVDVWLNGVHLLRSESMFLSHAVAVAALDDDNVLCLRFAALTPVLAERRPRPRWKARGVVSQNLRWIRTTLLGRQAGWADVPAPVGPWRPIRLRATRGVEVSYRRLLATCAPGGQEPASGSVSVELELTGSGLTGTQPVSAEVTVAGRTAPMSVVRDGDRFRATAEVSVDHVERWWPHTHGGQPRYPVRAEVAGYLLELGDVGFRTVEARRDNGGFSLEVNGEAIFCRGACWYPPDPVGYHADDDEIDRLVGLATTGGMNMLRIPGGTVYEDERFFDACDRAGVLVWQDSMLGMVDPPDDEEFTGAVVAEVSEVLVRAAAHPCLAVFCGGQELEEQPAMSGLSKERSTTPLIHSVLPALVGRLAPGLPYVATSPSGGDLPFRTDAGVSHYFGVGMFLFPLTDLRRSAPRFVAEGLAFAVPPERASIDEEFGGDPMTLRQSEWRRAVHRDAGSWFDLEDVRDHYAAALFGVDMALLWRSDPERALDLGRATVAEIMAAALAEWRRTSSPCAGFLSVGLRDLRPGPGWGLVDSLGRPKAPWYAVARASTPVAVLATDEGGNGLDLHLVNDTGSPIGGRLLVSLHTDAHLVEQGSREVVVPARGGVQVRADELFDGFRDLTYAYRFGVRTYELIIAELMDATGQVLADTCFLPGGPARGADPEVGLQAVTEAADDRSWILHVTARRFAQYVHVDVPGFVADDSWFHLPPGGRRTIALRPWSGAPDAPRGWVRALNSGVSAVVAP